MKRKHTLYFIGGESRVGKTTVFNEMRKRHDMITIQADAIRAGIRKALIGESRVTIEKLHIATRATFRRPGNLKLHTVNRIQNPKSEDDFSWLGILGLIEGYDRKNTTDVIIEGIAVKPKRVHGLKLKNLKIRAAFIGYNDISHLKAILAHSKQQKDWVHTSIKEHGGDTSHIEAGVRRGIKHSEKTERLAKKFGYGYFDVTARPFKQHVMAVVAYLSKNS
jgi:2-phosphoglycerate kinase